MLQEQELLHIRQDLEGAVEAHKAAAHQLQLTQTQLRSAEELLQQKQSATEEAEEELERVGRQLNEVCCEA